MPAYPGRPREFTYEKRRELLNHIGEGASVEEAAEIVGVSFRTVQREARHNEHFDHDLRLAVHAGPIDAHRIMERAARTHWRAAAWLLERTDPDRFAKRPPNSCRPETLMDMSDWLIETALEATPPEHRETVYRRMRGVADKALDVLMPDQHDARRSLVGSLPHRPMPLSQHEWFKTLQVVGDPHAPAVGVSSAPAGSLPKPMAGHLPDAPSAGQLAAEAPAANPAGSCSNGPNRDATHRRGAAGPAANRMTRPNPTVADSTDVADPVSYYRRHPWRQSLPYEPPGDSIAGVRLQDSEDMDAAWRYPEGEDDDDGAGHDTDDPRHWRFARADGTNPSSTSTSDAPVAHSIASDPPNGGIMSPKMSAATKCDATKLESTGLGLLNARQLPVLQQEGDGDGDLPRRHLGLSVQAGADDLLCIAK